MKLNELLETQSIFSAVNARQNFDFIEDPAELDLMLKISYGERQVFAPFEDLKDEEISMFIVNAFGEAWENYVKIELLSVNVDKRRELTETTNQSEDRTSTKNDLNKVAAFNSDDLIQNDGSDSNTEDGMVGDSTHTLTESNIDVGNSFKLLNDLSKHSIITKVIYDVARTITLDIY